MSQELQHFDIGETVRKKVRAMFSDLIPDEVLDGYLNKEIRGFFSDRESRSSYGGRTELIPHSSPFADLVRLEVLNYLKANLSAQIAEKVKTMVDEIGTEGLLNQIALAKATYDANIQAQVFTQVFNNLPNTIQSVVSQMKADGRF